MSESIYQRIERLESENADLRQVLAEIKGSADEAVGIFEKGKPPSWDIASATFNYDEYIVLDALLHTMSARANLAGKGKTK